MMMTIKSNYSIVPQQRATKAIIILPMPPKSKESKEAKQKVWNKSDDKKLLELIKQEGNGITLSSARSNVEAINKHWPHRTDWKQFSSLIRGKLQQWELESVIAGQRRAQACES